MNIQYRKLTINDLDTIIDMRINQLQEEGAKSTFDLRPQLLQYYTKHLQDNTFISYVATYNGKIIATSGISFVEKPPYYNNPLVRLDYYLVCTP